MAEAGTEVTLVISVAAQPVEVAQALSQVLPSTGNYLDDTQVVPVGPTSFRITRRFLPQWAVVCGLIGLFLCGLGLLAVFFRDTEVLTIDIRPGPDGSRVTIGGTSTSNVVTTIQSTLARFAGYSPESPQLAGSAQSYPGGPAAPPTQYSPDGNYWWDGSSWRPVPGSAADVPEA